MSDRKKLKDRITNWSKPGEKMYFKSGKIIKYIDWLYKEKERFEKRDIKTYIDRDNWGRVCLMRGSK